MVYNTIEDIRIRNWLFLTSRLIDVRKNFMKRLLENRIEYIYRQIE